jgi:hypothetical protein
MKLANLLFRLFNLIDRASAWFEMFYLAIRLSNLKKAMDATPSDVALYFMFDAKRRKLKKQQESARAKYTATFRPGIRFVWSA